MKELYILGAGASKASACLPIGSELVWLYYQDCSRMLPINNGEPDTSVSNTEFKNYIDFLNAVAKYYPKLKGEVAKFLKRDIYYTAPYSLRKEHYVDDLLMRTQKAKDYKMTELIRQLIFEHLIESSMCKSNRLYEIFISKILRKKSPEYVSIISFNFDYLLCEDFENEVYFDYLLNFDWIDNNRQQTYKKGDPITLIKLNGSFDWGICCNCGKLHLYFPHLDKFFYLEQLCRWCKAKVSPYIIMPHEEYDEKIQVLWEMARNLIKQAEKITVIGYSFPAYDTRVIKLFRDSMQKDTRIEVIDVCPENENEIVVKNRIMEKYRRMFPGNLDIRINTSGFKGFFKNTLGADNTIY